jgi:hypothetical protein
MPATAALAYPDAVTVVVNYLRAALAAAGRPVTVSAKVPNPRPVELVRVSRTGGPEVMPMIDGAQITVDCWAAATTSAFDIAALARRLVHNMAGTVQAGVSVHRVVEFGGPQDLPDPVSNTPRVTFTVQVQIRGQAA